MSTNAKNLGYHRLLFNTTISQQCRNINWSCFPVSSNRCPCVSMVNVQETEVENLPSLVGCRGYRASKTYGLGPYSSSIKSLEVDLRVISHKVNELCGIKSQIQARTLTSGSHPRQAGHARGATRVARCTKIINLTPTTLNMSSTSSR